jgi:hypothetical protein
MSITCISLLQYFLFENRYNSYQEPISNIAKNNRYINSYKYPKIKQ